MGSKRIVLCSSKHIVHAHHRELSVRFCVIIIVLSGTGGDAGLTPGSFWDVRSLGDQDQLLRLSLMVNDVRLTQESALRELRLARRFLGISKNGSKATVWNRLKREAALAKLKVAVEASEIVKAEYAREPLVDAFPDHLLLGTINFHSIAA